MYLGTDWDDLDPDEVDDFTIDFVRDLTSGETISGIPTMVLEVVDGVDANPASRIQGAPNVTGTKVTTRLATCQPEVYYRLTGLAMTSTGREIGRWSHFWCRTPN